MDPLGPLSIQTARASKAYGPAASAGSARTTAATAISSGAIDTVSIRALGAARLVAGTVSVPADPSLAPTMGAPRSPSSGPPSTIAMYGRAADRIDVAVDIAMGRVIDRTA